MIVLYAGTPGSGKTYDAVQKLLEQFSLRDEMGLPRRHVYSNIDGHGDSAIRANIAKKCLYDISVLDKYFHYLSPSVLIHDDWFLSIEEGSIVAIDETQKQYNYRDKSTERNRRFCLWCDEHRHQGIDIIFMTHDVSKIDPQLKSLLEWTYFYRKMDFFGNLLSIFFGKRYLRFVFNGDETKGEPFNKFVLKYEKSVFLCYRSYVAEGIKELGIEKRVNILNRPVFYLIPIVLLLLVYYASKSSLFGGGVFKNVEDRKPSTIANGLGSAASKLSNLPTAAPAQAAVVSGNHFVKVTGIVSFEGQKIFLLSSYSQEGQNLNEDYYLGSRPFFERFRVNLDEVRVGDRLVWNAH